MQDIKKMLKTFIVKNYLKNENAKHSDDDSFLEEGIIDSIGVIEIASYIQEKYGIKIAVPEIMPENFDTLNNLEKYITKKLKQNV